MLAALLNLMNTSSRAHSVVAYDRHVLRRVSLYPLCKEVFRIFRYTRADMRLTEMHDANTTYTVQCIHADPSSRLPFSRG